jgi:dienelactone hydrolase
MRLLVASTILVAALADASGASVRQWSVTLTDPERPGRTVSAQLMAPVNPSAPCPVAVLGHATMTPVGHYTYLATALVAEGWLVAMPTTEAGIPGDQPALAADMSFLGRTLREGAAGLPPDLPTVAAGGWAALGHSLGGGAAVLAAATDPTVAALALLTPQERRRPSMIQHADQVTAPTLVVAGELDCVTPPDEHQAPLFAALATAHKALCILVGGGHCGFAGSPEPCAGAEDACPPEVDAAVHQAHAVALIVPWLQWQQQGHGWAASAFLAAAAHPAIEATVAGIPTSVAGTTGARLERRDGGPGGGARWALTLPRPSRVEARLYDLRGRHRRTLVLGFLPSGERPLVWDGRDGEGRLAPAGVYLLRVDAAGHVLRDRVTVVR